jgi:hypothetical protein
MLHQNIQDRMLFGMDLNILIEIEVALVTTLPCRLQSFLRCSDQIANIVSTKVMIEEQTKCFPAILGLDRALDINVTRIAATYVPQDLPNLAVVELVSGTRVRAASDHFDVDRFISRGRIINFRGHRGIRANHILQWIALFAMIRHLYFLIYSIVLDYSLEPLPVHVLVLFFY